MNVYEIDAGFFKLDGGAMYGVVPKTFWNKQNEADENNLCTWKMRCLLVESGNRLMLIDTGMGDKQDEKWLGHYYRHGEGDLVKSIISKGFHPDHITDVVLSHLHFDHCGGAVQWDENKIKNITTFKNAKYWTHSKHWEWAMNPNQREKATFLKENLLPIQENGQLYFIDIEKPSGFENIEYLYADGHTEKMIMPLVTVKDKKLLFVADTIPSVSHIHIPWVMGYDVRPLQTMLEKENLLTKAVENGWILYFDHDPVYACATIGKNEKGFFAIKKGDLQDFIA